MLSVKIFSILGFATLSMGLLPPTSPAQSPLPSTAGSIQSSREDRVLIKKVGSAFKEAQNRSGGALDARLTEIWQAVALSEPEIEKYGRENAKRHGAVIYVTATGEGGAKSVRLVFYANPESPLEGKIGSKIKEWFLPQSLATGIARKVATRLQLEPSTPFTVNILPSEEVVAVTLSPKGSPPPQSKVLGESLFQK
jgi:hypothetical protein